MDKEGILKKKKKALSILPNSSISRNNLSHFSSLSAFLMRPEAQMSKPFKISLSCSYF